MKEAEFSYRVRQALNEGLEHIDPGTLRRLEQARRTAVANRKAAVASAWMPALAAAGRAPVLDDEAPSPFWGWLFRFGVAAPIVVLIVGFVSVYQWRQSQQIDELAAIDFALLLDDQPLSTYADRGFSALLSEEQQQSGGL